MSDDGRDGREITIHKDNNPKQFCSVAAFGEPNRGGACVFYRVQTPLEVDEEIAKVAGWVTRTLFIPFQNGHPKEVGYNGFLDSALLAVLIDRQEGFLEGPWPSEEGKQVLHHLKEALKAMDARVADRVKRGVMNTDNK